MDPSISETLLDPKHGKNEEINLCNEEFTMHIKNEHVDKIIENILIAKI